jgi:predicted transcriptional regulator
MNWYKIAIVNQEIMKNITSLLISSYNNVVMDQDKIFNIVNQISDETSLDTTIQQAISFVLSFFKIQELTSSQQNVIQQIYDSFIMKEPNSENAGGPVQQVEQNNLSEPKI